MNKQNNTEKDSGKALRLYALALAVATSLAFTINALPERFSEMAGQIMQALTITIAFFVMVFMLNDRDKTRQEKILEIDLKKEFEDTRKQERLEELELRKQERLEELELRKQEKQEELELRKQEKLTETEMRKQERAENAVMWASLLEKLDEQGKRSDERLEKAILLATGAKQRKAMKRTANAGRHRHNPCGLFEQPVPTPGISAKANTSNH